MAITEIGEHDQELIVAALQSISAAWWRSSEQTNPDAAATDGTSLRGEYRALAREAGHLAARLRAVPLPVGRGCNGHSRGCLELAFSWLVTAHDDTHYRGYLKESPELVAYRLGLLEPLVACVRAKCQAELAEPDHDDAGDYSPAADHHEEVDEFLAHSCNCEWCSGRREADMADDTDDAVPGLLRALDALSDTDLHRFGAQMGEMALGGGRLTAVYAAAARVAGFVLSLRAPESESQVN